MSEQAPEAVEATADDAAEAVDQAAPDPDAPLKKALHAERQTIKELKQQLAAIQSQQEEARLASMSETERAVEEARNAGRAEAMAEVKRDLVRAQVTAAAAAAGFADPADAAGFLALDDLEGDDAVKEAVTTLAQSKPYLLRKAPPQPLEQGPRGGSVLTPAPNDWLKGVMGARR